MPLSSQMQAFMRRQVATYLNDICAIKRLQDSRDELGGSSETYTTVYSMLACRILPQSDRGRNFIVGEGEKGRSYFRLTVSCDVDIQDGDRAELRGRDYEVQQIEDIESDAVFKSVRLMRLG